jgi:hypothetical protein
MLLSLTSLLAACGGSSGSADSTTVAGVVMAGPASGSMITVKTTNGVTVAGPVTTAADGTYRIAVPIALLARELIFEASGGTYQDEATAATGVPFGALSAHVPAGSLATGTNITIDPASTIIRELIRGGKSRAAALTAFATAFGYTPDSTIKPVFAGLSTAATTSQRLAGLRAAAFSQLTKDLGIVPAKQHELILALADDLSDDLLDGVRSGGTVVTTASGTPLPADIANRFATALMDFQLSANNRSKLKMDQIGAPPFVKKAFTASYVVEYLPGTMTATTGKSMFKVRLTNRSDGTPASGKAVTLRPYMYMAAKSHTTPMEAVVESGTPGTYDCTVYYVMSSAMNGMAMGVWELTVTIDATESARFYPTVAMPMGNTTLAKLSGIDDAIMVTAFEKRTWFLFNDGLSGTAGNHTFKLFLATKEMGTALTFPAVKTGDALRNEHGTLWMVTGISIEVSTDKTAWLPASDSGNGHWSASGLTGLSTGTAGQIYVRLTVNGEQKTLDGLAIAVDGRNGYQTFSVTPQ